ncbi:hypothetical protein ES707_03830 [subsurface metagenome]
MKVIFGVEQIRICREDFNQVINPSGPDLGEKGCIARLLKRRMEFEREIYDVFLGEKTLQGFFSYATQSWDIDKRKLSQMFYDCLEGLDDKEAKEIRKELGKFLGL